MKQHKVKIEKYCIIMFSMLFRMLKTSCSTKYTCFHKTTFCIRIFTRKVKKVSSLRMIKLTGFWFDKMRNQVSPLVKAVNPSLSAELPAIIIYSGSVFHFFLRREISKATPSKDHKINLKPPFQYSQY